jgi:hypothetical protein
VKNCFQAFASILVCNLYRYSAGLPEEDLKKAMDQSIVRMEKRKAAEAAEAAEMAAEDAEVERFMAEKNAAAAAEAAAAEAAAAAAADVTVE